jgi:D-3-phosphoglycerate dehydrogenase / 2-oxoglutarate reductase
MGDRPVVVVSQRLGALGEQERRLEAAGADLRSAALFTPDEIRANGAGVDVIVLGAVEPFGAAALELLPDVRAIVRRGIGVDNVDVEAATKLGMVVANVPDASVEEVSDHALALLLALERRIVSLDAAVHAGGWQRDMAGIIATRSGIRRLGELTLGVVGFGRIGRALARKSAAVYGRTIAADPLVPAEVAAQAGVELVPLEQLLTEADHISLHPPLTPETRHLISDQVLAGLRPGAIIVNTSRGGVVDQDAVVRALASPDRRLGGIGLDVTDPEPLPADHSLLRAPDVIVTAHSAVASTTAARELARRSVDAAIALLEGRLPDSIVNPDVLEAPNLRATELRQTA